MHMPIESSAGYGVHIASSRLIKLEILSLKSSILNEQDLVLLIGVGIYCLRHGRDFSRTFF
jgi:hypothetical protein